MSGCMVRHHRREHAEEDRREFRNIVALRAFLDVVEIIEAEADDLARAAPPASRISIRRAGGGRKPAPFWRDRRAASSRHCRGARTSPRSAGRLASTACRSMTVSPSTTPRRKPLFASKPTIFMSALPLMRALGRMAGRRLMQAHAPKALTPRSRMTAHHRDCLAQVRPRSGSSLRRLAPSPAHRPA